MKKIWFNEVCVLVKWIAFHQSGAIFFSSLSLYCFALIGDRRAWCITEPSNEVNRENELLCVWMPRCILFGDGRKIDKWIKCKVYRPVVSGRLIKSELARVEVVQGKYPNAQRHTTKYDEKLMFKCEVNRT